MIRAIEISASGLISIPIVYARILLRLAAIQSWLNYRYHRYRFQRTSLNDNTCIKPIKRMIRTEETNENLESVPDPSWWINMPPRSIFHMYKTFRTGFL